MNTGQLAQIREAWAQRPAQAHQDWRGQAPDWAADLPVGEQFFDWDALYAGGRVVWGWTLRVRGVSWGHEGPVTGLVEVLWSPDAFVEHEPVFMDLLVHRCQVGMRAGSPLPTVLEFAMRLHPDEEPVVRRRLPRLMTGGRVAHVQALVVDPRLLPLSHDLQRGLPIVVMPSGPTTACVLPPPFWPGSATPTQ